MKLHWGNAIFIFFTIFLTLAAIFITFSFRQKVDLVESDYYEQGANYTNQININNRSEIFQDSISISSSSEFVEINLSNSIKENTNYIHIHFFRPSDENLDLKYELNTNEDHQISTSKFSKGRYIAKIKWESENETYMVQKDLFIE